MDEERIKAEIALLEGEVRRRVDEGTAGTGLAKFLDMLPKAEKERILRGEWKTASN